MSDVAEAEALPTDSSPPSPRAPAPPNFRLAVPLFLATAASMFLAGSMYLPEEEAKLDPVANYLAGWPFALPLLAILLFHEFGHYIAARIHRVAVSLPYFIPVPYVTPFGTMGAVIAMPDRIRSRNALFDIGAAGPIAGLLVALPVLAWGLHTSETGPNEGTFALEGQSILYFLMKRAVLGPLPDGHDVHLNQMAFAGWAGLFVTAINLIPIGQLDGGHIAYALFGKRQNRYANLVHLGLLALFAYNVVKFVVPAIANGTSLGIAISNSTFYLFWALFLLVIRRRTGMNHPPTDDDTLSGGRRVFAWLCLALFVLLLMPTPFALYEG